jgi:hypothetical protein
MASPVLRDADGIAIEEPATVTQAFPRGLTIAIARAADQLRANDSAQRIEARCSSGAP